MKRCFFSAVAIIAYLKLCSPSSFYYILYMVSVDINAAVTLRLDSLNIDLPFCQSSATQSRRTYIEFFF